MTDDRFITTTCSGRTKTQQPNSVEDIGSAYRMCRARITEPVAELMGLHTRSAAPQGRTAVHS
jgi:hypothetical protein